MNWLNVRTETFRAPEYIGSEPTARATWFNVTAYCCEQENGGRIRWAALWKDRQWQQTCGVTIDEVRSSSPLVIIDGDDVVLWNYPLDRESEIQELRELGRNGGRAKTQAKQRAARENGSKGGRPKTQQTEETQAENPTKTQRNPIQWNGKEGNRNGREGEEAATSPTTASMIPGMPSKEQWLARIATPAHGCEWPEWWMRKWENLEKTGWKMRSGQDIVRWDVHQDSLIPYYRSDFNERKAKEVAKEQPEIDAEAIRAANEAERQATKNEFTMAVSGDRE